MPSTVIDTLLEDLIDYAGLFPPASLDMLPAVEEYHRQRRGGYAHALGRFIVPVGRLDEFAGALDTVSRGRPDEGDERWPLSVLVGPEAGDARAEIERFRRARVTAAELKATTAAEVERAADALDDLGLELFFELPVDADLSGPLETLARRGQRAKIRTGGVTPEAIPSIAQVARFVLACHGAGVAFKATAGLHHPLRGEHRLTYEPDGPRGTMHGFLDLFLAAAFLDAGEIAGPEEVEALLGERSAAAFEWRERSVRWRGHELSAEALAAARRGFARCYGSCSFAEPIEDLSSLGLL